MLPGMVYQLEPYWADFSTSGGADFGDYLAKRGPEVSESLLAVTDDMAQKSGRAAVVKAYQHGARRRRQEHRGGAARPRRDGAEVRLISGRYRNA